jgi:hypothetical protein
MNTIPEALSQLVNRRNELSTNLNAMNIDASNTETLAELVPRVLSITPMPLIEAIDESDAVARSAADPFSIYFWV